MTLTKDTFIRNVAGGAWGLSGILACHGALDPQESEAWGAWSAYRTLELAMACCGSPKNSEFAEEAAVVAHEHVAGAASGNDPQFGRISIDGLKSIMRS